MPDREKVIKGLDEIIHYSSDQMFYNDTFVRGIAEEANTLLKEQEAVEPRVSTAEQRCGHCNKVIEMDGFQFCPWCGKRIDWNGWWKKNGTCNQDS